MTGGKRSSRSHQGFVGSRLNKTRKDSALPDSTAPLATPPRASKNAAPKAKPARVDQPPDTNNARSMTTQAAPNPARDQSAHSQGSRSAPKPNDARNPAQQRKA